MGKPRMIIIIRHAQSEGNKNRDIHQTIPDHRVKLTSDGWVQAYEAGRRLRSLLRADDTLHFFTSPYRRTRETTEGILTTLTSADPAPSPFARDAIKVYEEPRLREQDFGNFQPCAAEMERMWQERADYGHFFYRIPNGESAADAYDRVSGFNESLWRQFGEEDFASVCVLVTHGLMSRVFLMKWYHFSVEYFEDLRNVNHCEFLIMRKQPDSGKYMLENTLRTWSQLRKDRAAQKERERISSSTATDHDNGHLAKSPESPAIPSIPFRKRWGGCPNGCDHSKHHHKKDNSMHPMERATSPVVGPGPATESNVVPPRRTVGTKRWQNAQVSGSDDDVPVQIPSSRAPLPGDDTSKTTEPSVALTESRHNVLQVDEASRQRGGSSVSETPLLGPAQKQIGSGANGQSSWASSDCDTDYLSPEEDARKRYMRSPLSTELSSTAPAANRDAPLKNRPHAVPHGKHIPARTQEATSTTKAEAQQRTSDADEEGSNGSDVEDRFGGTEIDAFEQLDLAKVLQETALNVSHS